MAYNFDRSDGLVSSIRSRCDGAVKDWNIISLVQVFDAILAKAPRSYDQVRNTVNHTLEAQGVRDEDMKDDVAVLICSAYGIEHPAAAPAMAM